MSSVTVPGLSGGTVAISTAANVGSSIIQAIATAMAAASPNVSAYTGSTPPTPTGGTNELLVTGTGGVAVGVPQGYNYIVDNTTTPSSLSGSNTAIISGTTGGAFWVAGNSTVAASGGNNTVVGQAGGDYLLTTGDGNDSLYNSGSGTLAGGGGRNLLWAGSSSSGDSNLFISNGTYDTIVAGPGSSTVAGFGTNALIFGGAGNLVAGIGDGATVSAGTGAETIWGGNGDVVFCSHSAGIIFVGGNGSASIVGSDKSVATLFGSSGSDINFYNSSTFGAVMVAGSGPETLNSAGSNTNNTLVGGTGSDVLAGGSGNDVLWAGAGAETMAGGAGANAFNFVSGNAGSSYVIADFTSNDAVNLINYGASAASAALSSATTVAGSTVITLSDHTQITFRDVTALSASNIHST